MNVKGQSNLKGQTANRKAVIVASGSIWADDRLKQILAGGDLVISVDGGARHLEALGLVPDIIIGDFDSIDDLQTIVNRYPDAMVKRFEARKDQTDSELALDYALEHGFDDIVFTGATGTRLDHTLANILMLSKAVRAGVKATVVDNHNQIYYLEATDESLPDTGQLTLNHRKGENVSILPLGEELKGIETTGLEYVVRDGVIMFGSSYGISNVVTEDVATIKLGRGRALVMVSRD